MAGLSNWFGVDDQYVRPATPVDRSDWVVVGVLFAFTTVNRELNRPLGFWPAGSPVWLEYLVIVTGVAPMLWRRRYPVLVAGYAFVHFFLACTLVPEVGYLLGYQAILFFALFSVAAWARDRRVALILLGAITVAVFGWLAWDTAVGAGFDTLLERLRDDPDAEVGLLPPITSSVLLSYLTNAVYVLGAVVLGRNRWWQARGAALLEQQAATIAAQSQELQQQAVVAERLRIARELHDVVAHHVSVMGIQAGAARTLLDRDPEQARTALLVVEESARTAVAEMRGLLGALRGGPGADGDGGREPEPTLAELPQLVESLQATGLVVDLTTIENPPGSLAEVALPMQLSLYRIISEALQNVQRHSTARQARVVLRAEGRPTGWVEAEILDDGRPLPGTSGSGLGQLGIRERVASHGGQTEIGPRATGGYRVRVRQPLNRTESGARHG